MSVSGSFPGMRGRASVTFSGHVRQLQLRIGHIYKNSKTGVLASYVGSKTVESEDIKITGFSTAIFTASVDHSFQNMSDGSVFVDNQISDWEPAGKVDG